MNKIFDEKIIISLGGSLLIPNAIDTDFIKKFKELILDQIQNNKQFVLIVGGGKTCRRYQKALSEITETTNTDLDWIGIHSTRFNAQLVRMMFGDLAFSDIILDPSTVNDTDKAIIIGAGWKPGWSTDYDAVEMAKTLGAKKIINLSNIDYVYDSDPKKNKEAKPVKEISWSDYRNIIPREWASGMNTPFDPIASKYSEELGLEVAIMNGSNLENLKNYIEGKDFKGTVIS